jgi:hypothetical protein
MSAWRKLGAQHPFGEHFRGYVDCVPEQYEVNLIARSRTFMVPQSRIQVTYLDQVGHDLGIGLAQIRAIGDQPQFVFWGLLQLLYHWYRRG